MKNLGGSAVRLFSCKVSELKWFWKCDFCVKLDVFIENYFGPLEGG